LNTPIWRNTVCVGAIAGFVGGVTIWLYELIVWVHFLKIRTVRGLLENTAVLAFGHAADAWRPPLALLVSTCVHFLTACAWGIAFAWIWPFFRRRQIEVTLVALFFGVLAWIIMHNIVLAIFSPDPPAYTTYSVLNGFVSHTFGFAVPLALIVKRMMR